jgi:hypothetical protein
MPKLSLFPYCISYIWHMPEVFKIPQATEQDTKQDLIVSALQ